MKLLPERKGKGSARPRVRVGWHSFSSSLDCMSGRPGTSMRVMCHAAIDPSITLATAKRIDLAEPFSKEVGG